nr:uncharacterized protein LOC109413023 [Aedes albopictus]
MSGRKSGKDGKSGSKGVRSKDKQSEVVEKSSDGNIVVVVTEEGKDPDGVQKDDDQVPEQDCTFCQEADNDEMVQCDRCDRWIHFACVGVTEEIANRSWSCPKCVAAAGVQLPSSSTTNRLATGLSTGREQQKSTATKEIVPKYTLGTGTRTGRREWCNTVSEPVGNTMPTRGGTRRGKTDASMTSSSSRRSLLQLQLQRLEEEQEYEKQQAEKHRAYMDRKYELLEQMHSQTGSECSRSQDRVRQWVNDTNNIRVEDALDPRVAEVFAPQRHSTQNYSGQAQSKMSVVTFAANSPFGNHRQLEVLRNPMDN